MIVLHFVTEQYPPSPGGMELWSRCLLRSLSKQNFKVILYIGSPIAGHNYDNAEAEDGIEVRLFRDDRDSWEEPLVQSSWPFPSLSSERARLDFLSLRNLIGREIERQPTAFHVVASTFISGTGFLVTTVTEDLSLPHIACVVGTDCSRGLRNPAERSAIATVVAQAAVVVTRSNEHARALKRAFGSDNIQMIHTSIDARVYQYDWTPSSTEDVSLFSDIGFSHKKGTQVLMWCFAELRKENIPVRLTIVGETVLQQGEYWSRLRRACSGEFGSYVQFEDHLELPRVWSLMQRASVYCSPTLGEGCSHARTAALCMGMPIVTTSCGEIIDVASDAPHVRLAPAGDRSAFLVELGRMCRQSLSREVHVDRRRVEEWRSHFSLGREIERWKELLTSISLR